MRLLNFFALGLITLSFCSCRQYRYLHAASKINTPMVREKGDSRLNASFSVGESDGGANDSTKNSGLDIQAAYALTKHWAVTAAFYWRWEQDLYQGARTASFEESYVRYNRRNWELGTGFFTTDKSVTMGIYGGVGLGKISWLDLGKVNAADYSRSVSASLTRYFLQPSFTFGRSDKVRFDFSMRFALMNFSNVDQNYSTNEMDAFNIRRGLEGKTIFSRETALTLSVPIPPTQWMRIEASYNLLTLSQCQTSRQGNFSIGLTANIAKAFKQSNSGD